MLRSCVLSHISARAVVIRTGSQFLNFRTEAHTAVIILLHKNYYRRNTSQYTWFFLLLLPSTPSFYSFLLLLPSTLISYLALAYIGSKLSLLGCVWRHYFIVKRGPRKPVHERAFDTHIQRHAIDSPGRKSCRRFGEQQVHSLGAQRKAL